MSICYYKSPSNKQWCIRTSCIKTRLDSDSLVLVHFAPGVLGHFLSLTLEDSNKFPGEFSSSNQPNPRNEDVYICKGEKSCVSFTVILADFRGDYFVNFNNHEGFFYGHGPFIGVDRFLTDFYLPCYGFYRTLEKHQGFTRSFREGYMK